jgi:hypothetical protein
LVGLPGSDPLPRKSLLGYICVAPVVGFWFGAGRLLGRRRAKGVGQGVGSSWFRAGTGSGAAGIRSRTAAEAWFLWPTDRFLEASLVRRGPRLVGKAGEWPYLWQKSQ